MAFPLIVKTSEKTKASLTKAHVPAWMGAMKGSIDSSLLHVSTKMGVKQWCSNRSRFGWTVTFYTFAALRACQRSKHSSSLEPCASSPKKSNHCSSGSDGGDCLHRGRWKGKPLFRPSLPTCLRGQQLPPPQRSLKGAAGPTSLPAAAAGRTNSDSDGATAAAVFVGGGPAVAGCSGSLRSDSYSGRRRGVCRCVRSSDFASGAGVEKTLASQVVCQVRHGS